MTSEYMVGTSAASFGLYITEDEQAARDACAVDAGYRSESDMEERLGCPS